jgi:hypothetical protein
VPWRECHVIDERVKFIARLLNRKGCRGCARLTSFMHYDLGYFDDQTCRLEPIAHPFGPKVLPMSPE